MTGHIVVPTRTSGTLTGPLVSVAPVNVVGAEWQTDAYRLAPGFKVLHEVHGGEHSLGGDASARTRRPLR
ncbi:MAG TPA: hypothetical protein VFY76_04855 [Nocardioides sp.]|nr:hypothetical protein [Nocardioides sp.]